MSENKLRISASVRPFHALALLVGAILAGVQTAGAATFNPFKPQASTGSSVAQGSSSPITVPRAIAAAQTPGPTLASFSISDAPNVVEASGAVATFRVTLSKALSTTVSVKFSTLNGTASAGSDFVAKSGTLTFLPGQTSKVVTISIINNAEPPVEPTEFFYVALSNSIGAQIARSVGRANITETPAPSPIRIFANDAPTVNEGQSPQFSRFTVTLSRASTGVVTVRYFTSNGTAKAGFDYKAKSGTLTFQPGQTSKTVSVEIIDNEPLNQPPGDQFIEDYFLNLADPTGAQFGDSKARGTIRDFH
jgi:hypothetical protein